MHGISPYATPLFPTAGNTYAGQGTTAIDNVLTNNTLYSWYADNTASGTTAPSGSRAPIRKLVSAALSGDTTAQAYIGPSGLNLNTTDYNTSSIADGTTMLPKSYAYSWAGTFIPSGSTFTSDTGNNYIKLVSTNPLYLGTGSGNTPLQYRVVYGRFPTSGGQFKLLTWNNVAFSSTTSAYYSTQQTGSELWKTEKLSFTGPAYAASKEIRCTWDGFNNTNSWVTGPFAGLWHSIIRTGFKGYAVNNFIYHGGATTTMLADRIEGCDKLLNSYLDELIQRQKEAGGSGRVLVWINSGLNNATTPDTGATWTAAMDRIISRIVSRWEAVGGLRSNLSFVVGISHPTQSAGPANAQNTVWAANRSGVASVVNAWGKNNANNGYGVAVYDINDFMPLSKLTYGVASSATNLSLYNATSDAHLNSTTTGLNNGYDMVLNSVISSLLSV